MGDIMHSLKENASKLNCIIYYYSLIKADEVL